MSYSEGYPRCYLSEPMTHEDSVSVEATPTIHAHYFMPEEEIRYVVYSVTWCVMLTYIVPITYW